LTSDLLAAPVKLNQDRRIGSCGDGAYRHAFAYKCELRRQQARTIVQTTMSDSERAPEQQPPDPTDPKDRNDRNKEPAAFWRRPAFAAVAALIALIGAVWRCA
jgi:hypothetical protein